MSWMRTFRKSKLLQVRRSFDNAACPFTHWSQASIAHGYTPGRLEQIPRRTRRINSDWVGQRVLVFHH